MEENTVKKRVVGVDISFPIGASPNINNFVSTLCDRIIGLVESYGGYGSMSSVGISAPSANYVSVVDPEAFIFTGGISKAGKWLMEPAREFFEHHVFHNIRDKVKFLTSDLDANQHDVLGASVLAWEEREYSLFK